ncbi:MAG: GGDEF domain-containing protein [Deltaproteobacteria bacterium]|nr:GGDEF domain-containing protein [Deltaproteobacteria bacterium]
MLDVPTLLFALMLTDVVLAASLWVALGRADRQGVGAWTISLLLQATFFVVTSLRGPTTDPLTTALTAAAAAAGYSAQLAAVLRFYGRRTPPAAHAGGALAVAAILGALAARPQVRIVVASVIYGATMFAMAAVARGLHREERRMGNRLLVVGLVSGGAVLVVRGVLAALHPEVFLGFHSRPEGSGAVPVVSAVFAHAVTIACSLGFLLMHRERHEDVIERLAMTDPLTGAYNRRTLFELGGKEVARARRTGSSVSVVILDIDHFKRINDTHGHQTGDAVLEGFVAIVRGCLRRTDLLARYGGEEFCVVLPGESKDGARVLAERIRAAVEAGAIGVEGRTVRVTSSAGIASLADVADLADASGGDGRAAPDSGLSAIVGRADEALYEAKRSGRNRVVVAQAA